MSYKMFWSVNFELYLNTRSILSKWYNFSKLPQIGSEVSVHAISNKNRTCKRNLHIKNSIHSNVFMYFKLPKLPLIKSRIVPYIQSF